MDPSEISKLGEFSTTLTHVLSQLESKFREGKDGSSKIAAIQNSLERHSAAIKSLEQTRDENRGTLDEALTAHAQMGRNVIDMTSSQCSDIQKSLVELRNDTKNDLNRLQGTLQVSFQESLELLLLRVGPPPTAEFPAITSDMAPEEVLRIMHGRIQMVESKLQAHDAFNEGIREALARDRNSQDRFDEMANRMVKMERNMEAQNKRFDRSERIIENLKVSQTKMEKALQFANRKIRAVASGDVLPEDLEIDTVGVEALSAENRGVLPARASQHTSEAGVPGESSKAPSEAGDPVPTLVVYKPIKDGARMSSLKNKLKGERNSHRIDQNMTQSTVDKSGEEMGIIDHTPSMDSQDSLDSRGLVDDYMLGKIDTLDSTIREDLSVKVLELELNAERLQNTLKTLQDSVKELEKAAENAKEHPVEPEYDHASHVRKYFKGVTYEAKDGWERVFDELDKKVARMEYLIAQSGEKPDEYALRLIAYRAKMEKALEDIDASLATMKEAEASNAPDVKEVVLASLSPVLEGLMQESEAIAGLEATYKQNYDKKIPGQAIPISQMPSKLPDVITSANKKSTNFLDEGISHVALKKRLGEMETAIDERVCSSTFQKFDDDIRIALTLKADNKALEAVNIKKASCLELQKFREHVADEIDSMRELLVKNSANASKMLASVTSSKGDNGELAQRFDILYGQFQEVQRGVSAFVPRPEIELALQALLDEVKSVQRTTVDKDLLFEKLKKKADRGDVDRLLTLLSGSIGDPQNGFAAAMHKCLVCDKPTNPFNVADDSSSPTRVRPNQSATMRVGERTGSPSQGGRPATSSGALGRGRTVNTEVNILRNSMETLPPVHTPGNEREGAILSKNRQVQKRIRATAGGGVL